MVSKPFVFEVFEVFVVKSAQAVTLSILVLMCITINDRTALKVTDVGLKLHHPKWGEGGGKRLSSHQRQQKLNTMTKI